MARRQHRSDDIPFSNRERGVFLSGASYDLYHRLFAFMIVENRYRENKYYQNVTEEMHMKLYEISAQVRNVYDLMCNIGNRIGEYKNSSLRQKLVNDMPTKYSHECDDTAIIFAIWKHVNNSNCSITIKNFQTHPIIESALSLLCERLEIHRKLFNENDVSEKNGINIITVAIETFEHGLQMLQDMHQKNGTTVGNYVSPKYQRHDDIVAEIMLFNSRPYMYNRFRNISTDNTTLLEPQIKIIDSSSPQYEIEIDLNVPITPQTEKKYRTFVASIVDGKFCLFEKHLPLHEIDCMIKCDTMSIILMFLDNKKYCSQKILIEKKIYQDIVSKPNGKYGVTCVDHIKYDNGTFNTEKRLLESHLYSLALSPRRSDVETEITIYNHVTIDRNVIVNRKMSANKITCKAMTLRDSVMQIYPILVKLGGVRFRLDDVIISQDTLSLIKKETYSCIKIKPVVTPYKDFIYCEYALVSCPLDDRLVNVNIYDPKQNIKKNVILDETTYFVICGKSKKP